MEYTLEITLQRRIGDHWPVVAERTRPNELMSVRTESTLRHDPTDAEAEIDPLRYGTVLGQSIFHDTVLSAFHRAVAESGQRLRVLLTVEDPDLRILRWERVCVPVDGGWDFLALDQRLPFSLYLPSSADRRFRPIGRSDLQALVVVANPVGLERYGLDAFDATAIVEGIRASLGPIRWDLLAPESCPGAVDRPTLDVLCSQLVKAPYTLLHLVCHGRLNEQTNETIIYLADADGRTAPVRASRLLRRLRLQGVENGVPHFAFLATCQSGTSTTARGHPEGQAMGGLAQRLVRDLGMPAVLAMTDLVTVSTVRALTESFYRRLLEHGEPDLALVEATAGLAERHDVTVPVLFSRLGGRPLFTDAPDRELTRSEIESGLARLRRHLRTYAPVLRAGFDTDADRLRRTLANEPAELSDPARDERAQALARIDSLTTEALDLRFAALARGQSPPPYDARCPFRGMYAFRARDRKFFFGREALVERLLSRLAEHPFLAVLGPSGSGKSSLVLAGLVPALRVKGAYLRPGRQPRSALRHALATAPGRRAVIVVDQFEELFTLCTDEHERRAFLDELVDRNAEQRIVVTMRADFWGECAPYERLRALMQAHQELIPPMAATELRRVMELQAKAVGLRFEGDLGAAILDDVQGEPGAMPLLQHALRELWQRRRGRWLRSEEYRAIGGVRKAITHTAEDVFQRLSPDDRGLAREIFLRLTRVDDAAESGEPRDTRQRLRLEDLTRSGDDLARTKALVKRLADEGARLVVTSMDPLSGAEEVEVAHEALIRHWPRLREWLEDDRASLHLRQAIGQAALEWHRSADDPSYLVHRGRRLHQAESLWKASTLPLNEREAAYVRACVALREEEKAREAERRLKNLAETGWGVIFAQGADPAIRDALKELLVLRRSQAARTRPHRYREFSGDQGYLPGESKRQFLARHGVGTGPPDPDQMPYYLLVVGDPETIPYSFQYQLDIQYAVGRIHFDSLDEYASYAHSVVAAESTGPARARRVGVFAPKHAFDSATELGMTALVEPLIERLPLRNPSWDVQAMLGEAATKACLRSLLGGRETPALLFIASHGMGFLGGNDRQTRDQGAILCQDWPGPVGQITEGHYFSGNDVGLDATLLGLVVFMFAAYSAGTPKWEDFPQLGPPKQLAANAFTAHLPQRLLGHPKGGALAVIGHVERTWGYSFLERPTSGRSKDPAAGTERRPATANIRNIGTFVDVLVRLMDGYPVGAAMESINRRYVELASELASELLADLGVTETTEIEDRQARFETHDARNFVILGDPAVSLIVEASKVQETPNPATLSPAAIGRATG